VFFILVFPLLLLPWLIWPTAWRALRAPEVRAPTAS
jgi:hypothetical protein